MSYVLYFEYGMHRFNVRVSRSDFFKVIDEFSNEFTIYKSKILDITIYQIVNYYGDFVTIGEEIEHD